MAARADREVATTVLVNLAPGSSPNDSSPGTNMLRNRAAPWVNNRDP